MKPPPPQYPSVGRCNHHHCRHLHFPRPRPLRVAQAGALLRNAHLGDGRHFWLRVYCCQA